MDFSKVTDVKSLKVLKSDIYDSLEAHTQGTNRARADIEAINARLQELALHAEPATQEKPATPEHVSGKDA